MKLSAHFNLAEFEATSHREYLDSNRVPDGMMGNLRDLVAVLERVRMTLCGEAGRDVPIVILSGYRCPPLNRAVGGSTHSHHMLAAAADWIAPRFGTPLEVCRFLAPRVEALGIGQLIHEYGAWVHLGVLPVKPINRVLTYRTGGMGPLVGIQPDEVTA